MRLKRPRPKAIVASTRSQTVEGELAMAVTNRTTLKAKELVETALNAGIRPKRLRELLTKWCRMQAGSSHQKCKGHSTG